MKTWHLTSVVILLVILYAGFWLGKNKPTLLGNWA